MQHPRTTAIAATIAAASLHAACGTAAGCFAHSIAYRQRAIPALPHAGDRRDAPPLAERGNGVFVGAAYDPTGTLLITLPYYGSAPMHVWDANAGTIVSSLQAGVPGNNTQRIWMFDGPRTRLFAQKANSRDFALFDLLTGNVISSVPYKRGEQPPFPVGLNAAGQALVFTPGFIELWNLDPPAVARREPTVFTDERYVPTCVVGVGSTYHDKHCWEWSTDRRTLALAYNPEKKVGADTEFVLIDTATLQREPIERPQGVKRQTFAYFAFSPDNRWLAVGMRDGMRFYDRRAREWGREVNGDHPRNDFLAPIRFSADSSRVIALGDQLQVAVYDPQSGARFGGHTPTKDDWEGVIEASADGSRVVLYKFSSDTIEVLDGANARRIGWVCPYFCNMRHNPVQVPYAVSPDGRSVAMSHRRGAAVWDTDTDTIRFPLHDPKRKPLPYPSEP
jgi:hypothetical protein